MSAPTSTSYKDTLIVPIVVIPPLIPDKEPQLVCPPFILPPGDWLIVWNLVTVDQPEVSYATFPDDRGIYPMLGQEPNFSASFPISATQWGVRITNSPKALLPKAFPLAYVVAFLYQPPGANERRLYTSEDRAVIQHDPTIVVSQDPINPPAP